MNNVSKRSTYKVLVQNDTLLSVEFTFTQIDLDTIYDYNYYEYYSLPMNPSTGEFFDVSRFLGDDVKPLLYKYVDEYCKKEDFSVNMLSYTVERNTVLTWGFDEKHFILYIGGEGEGHGFRKVFIPLEEFGIKPKSD